MIYTTYDLHIRQREILNEARRAPVTIRRRGERFVLSYEVSKGADAPVEHKPSSISQKDLDTIRTMQEL